MFPFVLSLWAPLRLIGDQVWGTLNTSSIQVLSRAIVVGSLQHTYVSYSLNSAKRGLTGDYIGSFIGLLRGMLGVSARARGGASQNGGLRGTSRDV